MTLIRRTSPFGELLSLRPAMDRLMEDSFVRPKPGLTADEHPLALVHIPRAEEAKARQIPVTAQPNDAGQPADARSTNKES